MELLRIFKPLYCIGMCACIGLDTRMGEGNDLATRVGEDKESAARMSEGMNKGKRSNNVIYD